MTNRVRDSGLEALGPVSWGTHVCQFYDTPSDLLRLVSSYIGAGLKHNEICVWVTGGPVDKHTAISALERQAGDLAPYWKTGQLELVDYQDVYSPDSLADQQRIIDGWVGMLDKALDMGYDGLRITGDPFWLSNRDEWKAFAAYEAALHRAMRDKPVLALCTYGLHHGSARDVLDVLENHHSALVHRQDDWELLECARDRRTRTELAEAHEELRLHQQILDHLAEGVALVRAADALFVYANPRFEQIFGYGPGELVGLPVTVVNAATEKTPNETAEEIIGALQRHGAWRGEVRNLKKDGTPFWCSVSVSTFEHGQHGTVWLAVHIDISEQKATEAQRYAVEAALKNAHEELERRIADRTAELAVANAKLTEKIADLEAFHDVVVGRELRLMELEREVARLREELRLNRLHASEANP